ncbi:MAG: hypothetical protein ISS78_06495 [Phycisphaerae bacterium]|nr:hypothetical protein [Phycisphaerae bacterium]
MSDKSQDITAPDGAVRFVARTLGNANFLVAAAILLLAAAGWNVAVWAMHLATEKSPVPWPAPVDVNDKFVMTTMPDRMGPYEFVSADGEIDFSRDKQDFVKDGRPDGEGDSDSDLPGDLMESLGIGTYTDQTNLPLRRSNWLTIRTYRDNRRPPGDPLRYWRLEVYYYTGGVDLVPHTPERCLVAGGAEHLGTTAMPVAIDGVDEPWGPAPLAIRRALFQWTDAKSMSANQFAQYYIFSLNGMPENSPYVVRLKLANPLMRHAYFAKAQFAPAPAVQMTDRGLTYRLPTPAEADPAAEDFVKHFMPHVLKMLPMPQDVAKLDSGDGKTQSGS